MGTSDARDPRTMMHFESASDLYAFIADHGAAPLDEAERTTRALLELIGPSLAVPALHALAAIPGFDVDLVAAGNDAPKDVADLVERAAARANTEPSHALELAYVVGRAIADMCGPAAVGEETPPEIADLIVGHEPAIETAPEPPHPAEALLDDVEPRTLATGHPRIAQPISQAKARAQHGSVEADINPHGDSKLSSGRR
jgi:hypothetical protein